MNELINRLERVVLSLAIVAPMEVRANPSESTTCARIKELAEVVDELKKLAEGEGA